MRSAAYADFSGIRHEYGVSIRSQYAADPIYHVIQRSGSSWALWCSGSPALKENTLTHRPCPNCLRLAREEATEYGEETNDAT